jgi:hypothetical protein
MTDSNFDFHIYRRDLPHWRAGYVRDSQAGSEGDLRNSSATACNGRGRPRYWKTEPVHEQICLQGARASRP